MYTKILHILVASLFATGLSAQPVAFVDVNLIAMLSPGVEAHQTVVVKDGFIETVVQATDAELSPDTIVIDGRGRYLMPGLIDSHVHLEHLDNSAQLKVFLQYGVTTVRNMDGRDQILDWRSQQAAGALLSPRIFSASPLIDGVPPIWAGSVTADSTSQARSLVRAFGTAGYDQIKVYSRLSHEVFMAIVEEASLHGLKVVGHVPSEVGLTAALEAGLYSFEHLSGVPGAIEPGASAWHPHKRYLVTSVDQQKLKDVERLLRESDVYNCPTLVMHEQSLVADTDRFAWSSHSQLSHVRRLTWLAAAAFARDTATEEAVEAARQLRYKLVRGQAHGERLILGTDSGIPFVFPGDSAHRELALMVAAGLTNYQALQTATKNAAKFLDLDAGRILPGLRADMVLLEHNPLENIEHTRDIVGVMIDGQWLDGGAIGRIALEQSW